GKDIIEGKTDFHKLEEHVLDLTDIDNKSGRLEEIKTTINQYLLTTFAEDKEYEGDIMKYVIGVDLGTSAVKIVLVNMYGDIVQKVSKPLQIFQPKTGYSEQHPNEWVDQTIAGLSDLLDKFTGDPADIEGISFSGQMHGLVLLDKDQQVLRPAILWSD